MGLTLAPKGCNTLTLTRPTYTSIDWTGIYSALDVKRMDRQTFQRDGCLVLSQSKSCALSLPDGTYQIEYTKTFAHIDLHDRSNEF